MTLRSLYGKLGKKPLCDTCRQEMTTWKYRYCSNKCKQKMYRDRLRAEKSKKDKAAATAAGLFTFHQLSFGALAIGSPFHLCPDADEEWTKITNRKGATQYGLESVFSQHQTVWVKQPVKALPARVGNAKA